MAQSILNDLLVRLGLWFHIEVWSIVVEVLPAVCWGGGGAGGGCSRVLLGDSITATRPRVDLG